MFPSQFCASPSLGRWQHLFSTTGAAGCYCRVSVPGSAHSRQGYWLGRGLLLRTAWASNSCDKCSSHGDGSHFSQTNNRRMFICGSPHLGLSACLPLSLYRRIGGCVVCVCLIAWLSSYCPSAGRLFVFPHPFVLLYFLDLFWFTRQACMCTWRSQATLAAPPV